MQLMWTHVCVHVAILWEDFFAGGALPGRRLRLPPMGACAVQLKRFRSSEPLAEQVVGVSTGVGGGDWWYGCYVAGFEMRY